MPQDASAGAPGRKAARPAADPSLIETFRAELDRLLAKSGAQRLAIALSGGPDSTALLHLTHALSDRLEAPPIALIVNHGIRREAADEAARVRDGALALGVEAGVLTVVDPAPATGVQAWARAQRYALMAEECRRRGVDALLLGHHLDDQAATVLMRLRHGSGLDGLAAMRPQVRRQGLSLLRPLLGVRKQALVDWLDVRGIAWVTDASNGSPAFERNRLRQLLETEDAEGRLTERLSLTARRLARASETLNMAAEAAFQRLRAKPSAAEVCLEVAGWLAEPEETRIRVLARAVAEIDADAVLKLSGLERLATALERGEGGTLAGVRVKIARGVICLSAAPPRRSAVNPET